MLIDTSSLGASPHEDLVTVRIPGRKNYGKNLSIPQTTPWFNLNQTRLGIQISFPNKDHPPFDHETMTWLVEIKRHRRDEERNRLRDERVNTVEVVNHERSLGFGAWFPREWELEFLWGSVPSSCAQVGPRLSFSSFHPGWRAHDDTSPRSRTT